jgi:hypothetical protein
MPDRERVSSSFAESRFAEAVVLREPRIEEKLGVIGGVEAGLE